MRIIKFTFYNGYVGGDVEEVEIYSSDTPNDVINMSCDMMRAECAEDYAYLAHGYPWEVEEGGYFEDEDEATEAQEDYYSGCECGWDEITIDELKEWCEGQYGDFESRYEPQIKEMLEKEAL